MRPQPFVRKFPIEIIIYDPHEVYLEAIAGLLHNPPDIEVVERCMHIKDIQEALYLHRNDMIIIGFSLVTQKDAIDMIHEIQKVNLSQKIFAMLPIYDDQLCNKLVAMGVKAVLVKTMPPEEIIGAVRKVFEGKRVLVKKKYREPETLITAVY